MCHDAKGATADVLTGWGSDTATTFVAFEATTQDGIGALSIAMPPKKKKTKKKNKQTVRVCTYSFRGNLDLIRICLSNMPGWTEEISNRDLSRSTILWVGNNLDNMRFGGGHDFKDVAPNQRVSRFEGLRDICGKVSTFMLLNRLKKLYPEEYKFAPRTWLLPTQADEVRRELHSLRKKQKRTFILKPDTGSEGNGIVLFQKEQDLSSFVMQQESIVQDYIAKPLLLDSLKFDLRIYVLVTSADPLEV